MPAAMAEQLPYVNPEIVSAWVASDGNSVMIFRYDGIYHHIQGTAAQAGFERGSFTWNKTSGALTVTQAVDTNGTAGLSHPSGAINVAISGDTLTRTIGGSATTFTRVTNTAGSIVGAWSEPGYPDVALFLANGNYYFIDEDDDVPDDHDGIERGTYTWNSSSKILTASATLETDGESGLGSLPPGVTATVSGNMLSVVDPGDDPDVFHRLTTNSTPLRLPDFQVLKVAEYGQTSASGPALIPLNVPNEDYPYQGEAGISPALNPTAPTLKIGSRTATAFETDEDDGSFFLEYGYGSKALLDAASAFPDNTNYVFANGAGNSATVNFPSGGTYPATPAFIKTADEDDVGEWQGGVYQMDGQTLQWTPHTGFNAATHLTSIEVQDSETDETIVDQILQGDVSVYELEGKLLPGRHYNVVISQVKIGGSTTAGTGIFSGKQGYALYVAANDFEVSAPFDNTSLLSIILQPEDTVAQLGTKVSLSVGLDSTRSTTLQWYKNGVAIPGQTGNSLTFVAVTQTDYADYTVKATRGSRSLMSDAASIVAPKPYDLYAAGIGLDPDTTGAAEADYDKDGYANLLEWVIGGDPKVAQANLLPAVTSTPVSGGRNLIFKYNRRLTAADTINVVEYSPTLSPPWTPATNGQGGVTMATGASPLGGLFEQVTLNIPVTGVKNFARLRVGPEVIINPETSYKNFKEIGLTPQPLPSALAYANARGYGDFFNDGTVGLFGAFLNYEPGGPATEATFGFWKKQLDGSYASIPGMITGNSGCVHPRKALVADFNGDHRPDVFVICHGYDEVPFPGERNRILLSQSNGTYLVQDAAPDMAFFHGGAAMDLDRDGDLDVITVRGSRGRHSVFLNQGNGTFKRELPGRLPEGLSFKNYFSLELMDVNEDGKPDLVAGGHEWEAPTVVYLNPGNSDFSAAAPITIPAVAAEGVVLDFLTTGTGATRALWVLRTSGGDGTFYQSRTLQKVAWPSLASTTPLKTRPLQWVDWMIPGISGGQPVITSDHAARGLSIPQ